MIELVVYSDSQESQIVKLLLKYLNLNDVSLTLSTNKDEELFLKLPGETEPVKHFPLMLERLLKSSPHGSLLLPTDPELKATMDSFVDFGFKHGFNVLDVDSLRMLDNYLLNETFFSGPTISLADVVLFVSVTYWTSRSKSKERMEVPNLMRWFDHLQHLPEFASCFEEFKVIQLFDEKLVMTEPKKGKPRAAYHPSEKAEKKKEKKEKPKVEKPPVETRPYDDVTRLNVVVGLVKSIRKHEDADKLYCLKIDVGSEVRSICSGLVDFLMPDQILDKKVCVLANLPKKNLRGEESNGMVLCVSNSDKSSVELLEPPVDAPVGERVYWEGYSGEADEQLSSKKGKDTFAMVQKDLNCKENVGFYKVSGAE
ncbi:methionine-tRNA ligase [Theileria orientalis strain Shintoku]|uniref:Methionine-tRNA ligase n=1 Tax=Theileria orientalis strain Shintoku TaxID=869250 RepID=J4C353_THEOR|nr:methionine-tRNA ligase [Theileria orientalis strain Shintoku]BAM39841.1 methionine-tRNA ligase [Theileria orientalis strain Shintoku]|eukprot:XP_009690142.1 methionine-tRNA ligase [Theileria orientalis strain Shintoku]